MDPTVDSIFRTSVIAHQHHSARIVRIAELIEEAVRLAPSWWRPTCFGRAACPAADAMVKRGTASTA
jgi:hypothetical protein